MFQTQKARGYRIISELPLESMLPWVKRETAFNVLPYNMPEWYNGPFFARPCPETPRHGFVESRKVTNIKELLDVYVEARIADPMAEVIVMRPLSGKASAVAMESGVTWGKGNDGATGGKGTLWNIPCPAGHFTKTIHTWGPQVRNDIKGSAFLEIVEDAGRPVLVQLRDGPMIEKSSGNYVPQANFKVQNVIRPDGKDYTDLLHWESRCKSMIHGTVVVGLSSLTNHLAVQAICHGLAVWTTGKEPKDGDILQPDRDQPPPLKRADYLYMKNALKKRVHIDKKSAVQLCIATLHSMPLWGREKHLLKLRAQSVVTMLRLLSAACIGENRHYNRCGPGSGTKHGVGKQNSRLPWATFMPEGTEWEFSGRQTVHDAIIPKSVAELHGLMTLCEMDFRDKGWESRKIEGGGACGEDDCEACSNGEYTECSEYTPGEKQYGYGGPKWADAAKIAKDIAAAVIDFRAKPRKDTWDAVVSAYNRGVMAAHNGGRALDKFTDWNYVDLCAKAPQFGFIGQMAMEIVADTKVPDGVKPKEKRKGGAPKESAVKQWPWAKPKVDIISKTFKYEEFANEWPNLYGGVPKKAEYNAAGDTFKVTEALPPLKPASYYGEMADKAMEKALKKDQEKLTAAKVPPIDDNLPPWPPGTSWVPYCGNPDCMVCAKLANKATDKGEPQ
jgi:hypothetical protein